MSAELLAVPAACAAVGASVWAASCLRNMRAAEREADEATQRLDELRRDRQLAVHEITLLRSLLPDEADRPIQRFVKALAPHPPADWAGLVDETGNVVSCRGGNPGVLDVPAVVGEDCRLEPADARAVRSAVRADAGDVWSLPVGPNHRLVTTRLGPFDGPDGLALLQRTLEPLTFRFRDWQDGREQRRDLSLTRHMLDLRALVESPESVERGPLGTVEAYMEHLVDALPAERASVLLRGPSATVARFATGGPKLLDGLDTTIAGHERQLVSQAAPVGDDWDGAALKAAGVDSLIASAFVRPVVRDARIVGWLVLSSGRPMSLTGEERELLDWVPGHLAETLTRSADRISMKRQATTDALTGLVNRGQYDLSLASALADRGPGESVSLILIDIDHFKSVNDTHGHQAGDEAIRHIASILTDRVRGQLRDDDEPTMARYGGEEMAVILPGVPSGATARIAETIRKHIASAPVFYEDSLIPITVSAGYATATDDTLDAAGLTAAADAALYHAKRTGRNRVCDASEATTGLASVVS